MKLIFPHNKQYSSFDNFLYEDSREIQKYTDLAKLLTLIQIEFFQKFYKINADLYGQCVSLVRFKYPATLKKTLLEMQQYKLHFPKLCFQAKYIVFHVQKRKVKNFVIFDTLLNFSSTFRFSFFPFFNVSLASLVMRRYFINFQVSRIFLVILFSLLRRTLYNT